MMGGDVPVLRSKVPGSGRQVSVARLRVDGNDGVACLY